MESNLKRLRIAEPIDLISFHKAEEILKRRFPDTTREEIEMWTFLGRVAFPDKNDEWLVIGQNAGGFTSYFYDSAKASTIDSLILCGKMISEKQVLTRLMDSQFSRAEIEVFDPTERWSSYGNLLESWTSRIGAADAEALIDEITKSGELEEYHPFTKNFDKRETAVFSLSQINLLEKNLLPAAATFETSVKQSHNVDAPLPSPTAKNPASQLLKKGNVTRHKLRKNSLDAPIIKAIAAANTLTPATVFVHLRELAIGEEKPFTGKVEGDALFYTDDNSLEAKLTKDALRQRLKNHTLPASSGG